MPAQYRGMKNRSIVLALALLLQFAACRDGPIRSSYRPALPELPEHWKEIPGQPCWRLEWIDGNGKWREWEGKSEAPDLHLGQEWTSPVLAWPFWPAMDLLPGYMRPAGALFPWDVSSGNLILSWEGGVEAFFWKELAHAEKSTAGAEGRLPWYFDWPRFRELLATGNIPENVRLDPWLPDWKSIAQRTVKSGFDRRRIVSRTFTGIVIPGLDGRWAGSSPFAPPLDVPEGCQLYIKASDTPDVWVSREGILKCSTSGWVLVPR